MPTTTATSPLLTRPAYRSAVWNTTGNYSEQKITAHHADALIRRALRICGPAAMAADVTGAVTLTRQTLRGTRTIRLQPLTRPRKLTDRQAADLEILRTGPTARFAVTPDGQLRLDSGMFTIPPAATWRLIEAGWVSALVLASGEPATVSAAGTIALALRTLRHSGTLPTLGTGLEHWQSELHTALTEFATTHR